MRTHREKRALAFARNERVAGLRAAVTDKPWWQGLRPEAKACGFRMAAESTVDLAPLIEALERLSDGAPVEWVKDWLTSQEQP